MSLLIVVPLALILSSFIVIPVSTYILAQYLENTSQIVIVVLGLLISYKIFTRTESDIEIFMRTFQDMARKNKQRGKERQQVRIRNKSKSRNKAPQLSQRKPSGEQKEQEASQQRTKIPIEEEETTTPTVEITQSQLESSDEEYENDVEAGGAIAGELTGKLINYLDTEEDNEQEEQKQKQDQDKKDQDKKDQDQKDQDKQDSG